MNAKDLKVGNILVKEPTRRGNDYYRIYRIQKKKPETVILDRLAIDYIYEQTRDDWPFYSKRVWSIEDEVIDSFIIEKRIVCDKYELYDRVKDIR